MPKILEDRDDHATVLTDDGDVEIISWGSKMNRLVYKHDLAGLVKHGDVVFQTETDEGTLRIIPDADATEFTIEVDDESFRVSKHQKTDLLDALDDAYGEGDDDGLDSQVLLEFVYGLMDTKVNPAAAAQFLALPVFDGVERTDEGWWITDNVLLTYNNELYQPKTRRTTRTGDIIEDGANKIAYDVDISKHNVAHLDADGQVDLGSYNSDYLGDDDELVEFVAKAIWAVTYVPE